MASLKSMSVAELRRELERREKGGEKLRKQHAKLAKRLAAIDSALTDLGVAVPARRGRKPGRKPGRRGPGRPKGSKNKATAGKRAKNSMSLLEAIMSGVRVGSTVSPAQAGAAAKAKGYKSSSPNFGMMVANALAKAPQFKRVGRGQYLLKGGGKAAGRPAKRGRRGRKPGRKPKAAIAAAT
jgi:hypothetical protein